MAHRSRLYAVVVDVPTADHDDEVTFWQGATGVELSRVERHPEYSGAELPGQDIALLIQRLGDGPPRVHVDIHTDDLDAEVSRLEALGAKRVRQAGTWWVMQDPAGLLFCVVPDRPGILTDANSHLWP
jgi:predicted enzyme related to lactoylglutathione lyase